MLGVVTLGHLDGDRAQLGGSEGEALGLQASQDLPTETALDAVRLHDDKVRSTSRAR